MKRYNIRKTVLKTTRYLLEPKRDNMLNNYDVLWSNYTEKCPLKSHPICTKIRIAMFLKDMTYLMLLDKINDLVKDDNIEEILSEEILRNVIYNNNINSKWAYYMCMVLEIDDLEIKDYFIQYLFENKLKTTDLLGKNVLRPEEKQQFISYYEEVKNNTEELDDLMLKAGYLYEDEWDLDYDPKLPKDIEEELTEIFYNCRDLIDSVINEYRRRKAEL